MGMTSLAPVAVLIFDEDRLCRESVRNFLLSAGCALVDVAGTARDALAKLGLQHYHYVFVGFSGDFAEGRWLAREARRLQPEAKVFVIIPAKDLPRVQDDAFDFVIKESVLPTLLELIAGTGGKL
jgi:DNA-binding NtrC family response regulator